MVARVCVVDVVQGGLGAILTRKFRQCGWRGNDDLEICNHYMKEINVSDFSEIRQYEVIFERRG